MSMHLKTTKIIFYLILLGSAATAKNGELEIMFSLTDGTGEPSDICISRAKKLAKQMESGSVRIKKQRLGEFLGPNDIHPRTHVSVTYELPNDQMARFYLTCNYGLPVTISVTQSGAACVELNLLSAPENTEPGVQDAFKIRLSDYEDFGAELFNRMVDQYRKEFQPIRAALTNGCAKIE